MAVVAQYDFSGSGSTLADSAAAGGYQNGVLLNGASLFGGLLRLDGCNDYARIAASSAFQLASGTLSFRFTQTGHTGCGEDTVLSRDSAGYDNGGHFSLATTAQGAIVVHHATASAEYRFTTPDAFFQNGQAVEVSYSWDAAGRGGAFIVKNVATGATYSEPIGAALTMDMGPADNEPWVIGASAENSADGQAGHLTEFFRGTVDYFSVSDSIDNVLRPDGIVEGTSADDLIDLAYTGDPDGDRIDAGDAILPGEAPNDDIVLAGDGNDTVWAGKGNDEVYGEAGNDTLHGEGGRDYVDGGDGDDFVDGGGNDDVVVGGAGNDKVYGDAGNDMLFGGDGDDYLDGGIGDDTLSGGAGADVQYGGDDRDTFVFADAGDRIDGGEGGVDYDTLDLSNWGKAATNIIFDPTNHENGTVEFLDAQGNVVGFLQFQNIENIVPCFTPGTLIATPQGERPVEDLRPGDRVVTRDNGIQEIAWCGAKSLDYGQISAAEHLRPVLIRAGALGYGLPERDMLVSPNHRMLVANDRTALYFEDHEVLVAAKHLVNSRDIRQVNVLGTTYIHFMCREHEVVLANGAWTESFQPGQQALNGLGNAQRLELFELFPELKEQAGRDGYKAARRTLKRHEAAILRF